MEQLSLQIKPYEASCALWKNKSDTTLSVWHTSFEPDTSTIEKADTVVKSFGEHLPPVSSIPEINITVILDYPLNCIVPVEFYKKELESTYIENTLNFKQQVPIKREQAGRQKFMNLFIHYPQYIDALEQYFDKHKIEIKHASSIFLDDVFWHEENQKMGQINTYIYFCKDYFYLAVTNCEQLYVYNIFKKENPKDTFSLLEKILVKIKPRGTYNLTVYGNIAPEDPFLKALKPLFKNILLWESRNHLFSKAVEMKPNHHHAILMSSL